MKKYRNEAILEDTEKVAGGILSKKRSFHHRDHFFPAMINELGYQFAAEVGVNTGDFSKHLVEKTKLRKLFCIDAGWDSPNGDLRMQEAEKGLNQFITDDRVELVSSTSLEASIEIPDDYLDFVYIDGDHSLEGIFNDLYAWTPKVRVGGIVAGHDYKDSPNSGVKDYWGSEMPSSIKTVADYYCNRYGYKVHPVGGKVLSWWFVKI